MTSKTQFYQWPNILAVDAALIAVAWQFALTKSSCADLGWPAHVVLGISVWLTYMADRLYDVRSHPLEKLISLRHRFAKKHCRQLWRVWWGALIINLSLATQLISLQLKHGIMLLAICLIYTFLNQKLSRQFFPKEICVALIYAGGVVVFLPTSIPLNLTLSFACLCSVNCLIIGAREKAIDASMRVHSIAALLAGRHLAQLSFASATAIILLTPHLSKPMATCAFSLGALHLLRNKIGIEDFRVLADATLLAGAIFAIL